MTADEWFSELKYQLRVCRRDLWAAHTHAGLIWITDPAYATTWPWPATAEDLTAIEHYCDDLSKRIFLQVMISPIFPKPTESNVDPNPDQS